MKYYITIFFCAISILSYSQGEIKNNSLKNDTSSINKWFAKNKISIRKSFSGTSKDEGNPASFIWYKDFQNNSNYTNIDLGIKVSEYPFLNNSKKILATAFPSFEWHKDYSNSSSLKNALNAGINFEFYTLLNLENRKNNHLAPVFTGSFKYGNDYVKKIETFQSKVFISFLGDGKLAPGKQTRSNNGSFKFRYYPYTGFENYIRTSGPSQSATIWSSRIFFEYYPISTPLRRYFQLTFDYTYRYILTDNLYNNGNMNWLSLGINIYPYGRDEFGFGIDFNNGNDPNNNFTKTDKLDFGVKIKF